VNTLDTSEYEDRPYEVQNLRRCNQPPKRRPGRECFRRKPDRIVADEHA